MAAGGLNLCWQWDDGGVDRATVRPNDSGWQAEGAHGETRYQIRVDRSGCVSAAVVSTIGAAGTPQTLSLEREHRGWRANGTLIADSENADDIDIACTALTNTIPIQRCSLAVGQTAELNVLYIPVPALTPIVVRQSYTRMTSRYLYKNFTSGFTTEIEVDSDGWVTDYPGVCHLVEKAHD